MVQVALLVRVDNILSSFDYTQNHHHYILLNIFLLKYFPFWLFLYFRQIVGYLRCLLSDFYCYLNCDECVEDFEINICMGLPYIFYIVVSLKYKKYLFLSISKINI